MLSLAGINYVSPVLIIIIPRKNYQRENKRLKLMKANPISGIC
jgi:hypothetical protein